MDVTELLKQYGPYLGIMLFVLISGARDSPAWVFGWVYRSMRDDRDQWRTIALKGTELGSRSIALAQSMTPQPKEP